MLFMPMELSRTLATHLFSKSLRSLAWIGLRGRDTIVPVKPPRFHPPLNFTALFTSMKKVGFS